MPDRIMENQISMEGTYNNIPFEDSKSTIVSVRLVEVPFTKTADQEVWFDGPLTFTLTIDNRTGEGDLTGLILTDTLDTTMFALDEDSIVVAINGTPLVEPTDYTVTYAAGLLTITFVAGRDLEVGSVATVTFRGTKVSP